MGAQKVFACVLIPVHAVPYICSLSMSHSVLSSMNMTLNSGSVVQGCHGTGKTGNLKVHFSRHGKHREFAKKILKICSYTGNLPPTQGKFECLKKKKKKELVI